MSNYSRGANFERAVQKDLERQGFDTVRSAGSHRPADIWAARGHTRWLVQCKLDGNISPLEREKLIELADRTNSEAWLAFRPGRQGIEYIRVGRPRKVREY